MLVCGLFAPITALAQTEEENLVKISATLAADKARSGAETALHLKLKLASGAHANSNQPADPNLIPTIFLPKPQVGLTWGQPKYPAATEAIEWYSTEPLSVFEDGAIITVSLKVDKTTVPGKLTLEGTLRIQICDSEKCYPPRRIPVKVPLLIVEKSNTKTGKRRSN